MSKHFLQLDDRYRIVVADQRNFSLEELQEVIKRDSKTKEPTGEIEYKWFNVGYHGLNLEHALNSYLRIKTRDCIDKGLATNIHDLMEVISTTSKEIIESIHDVKVIIRDGKIVKKIN